jgi:hypothetical protein
VNEPHNLTRDVVTDPAPDGIDEGRRLIRLGGDKGLSLADRLAGAPRCTRCGSRDATRSS